MGNELSAQPFNASIPPARLARRDLLAVAEYIRSGDCKNVVFMVSNYLPPPAVKNPRN